MRIGNWSDFKIRHPGHQTSEHLDARFLWYQPDSAARLDTASEQELQRELHLTLAVRRLGDDSGRCVRPSATEKDRIRIRRPVTSFRCRLRDVLFTHK